MCACQAHVTTQAAALLIVGSAHLAMQQLQQHTYPGSASCLGLFPASCIALN